MAAPAPAPAPWVAQFFPHWLREQAYMLTFFIGPIKQASYQLNRNEIFRVGNSEECRQLVGDDNILMLPLLTADISYDGQIDRFCLKNNARWGCYFINGTNPTCNQIGRPHIELFPGDQIILASHRDHIYSSFLFHKASYQLEESPNASTLFRLSNFPFKIHSVKNDFAIGEIRPSMTMRDIRFEDATFQRFFVENEAKAQYDVLMAHEAEYVLIPRFLETRFGISFLVYRRRLQDIDSWLSQPRHQGLSWKDKSLRKLIRGMHEAIYSLECQNGRDHGNIYDSFLVDEESKVFICNFRSVPIDKSNSKVKDALDLLKSICDISARLGVQLTPDLRANQQPPLPNDALPYDVTTYLAMFKNIQKESYVWILHHPIGWDERDEIQFCFNLNKVLHSLSGKWRILLHHVMMNSVYNNWWKETDDGGKFPLPLGSTIRDCFLQGKNSLYQSEESLIIFVRNVLEHHRENFRKRTGSNSGGSYIGLRELKSSFPNLISRLFHFLYLAVVKWNVIIESFTIEQVLRTWIIH